MKQILTIIFFSIAIVALSQMLGRASARAENTYDEKQGTAMRRVADSALDFAVRYKMEETFRFLPKSN